MKKRVPLVLTIVFISVFIVLSGIFIYVNCSSIKFKDIYGSRDGLGDVQLVFYKNKGIFEEELTVGAKSVNQKNLISETKIGDIDVLKDKKFFRGVYPTKETFFEDDNVMVDVTNRYGDGVPKLEVRFKDKKSNVYEKFEVKVDDYIHNSNRIDRVSYKDGKINILFSGNGEENSIIFGEINLTDKRFNVVDIINVDQVLNLNKEYSHMNSVMQILGQLSDNQKDKVYYKLTEINKDDKRGMYSEDSIVEVDVNTKEIKRYNPDENIKEEIKDDAFETGGKGGTMFEAYGDIYITGTSDGITSVLVFDTETKEFNFYKNLIENERLKRYGVDVSDLSRFIIVEDKVVANFIDNKNDSLLNKTYVAVIDVSSKNPIYVGELESGNLDDIKIAGGK